MKAEARYAKQYRCDVRTIRRWKADRAPLGSVPKMRVWLSTRQHIPAGTRDWLEGEHRALLQSELAKLDPNLPKGAAAALKRLESTEATLYGQLEAAIKSGDPVQIKFARESWLKVGDSLRRYDIAVEAVRRETGSLVPRDEVSKAITMLCGWLRFAWEQQNNIVLREIPDEHQGHVAQLLKRFTWRSILESAAMLGAQTAVPAWMSEAASRDAMEWLDFTAEDFERLTAVFKTACEVRELKLKE